MLWQLSKQASSKSGHAWLSSYFCQGESVKVVSDFRAAQSYWTPVLLLEHEEPLGAKVVWGQQGAFRAAVQ